MKTHIAREFTNVVDSAGEGENQAIELQTMNVQAKGYTKEDPDVELKCKLGNGCADVVAIELGLLG